ncbi:MAG: hydantoinase/oxoprolinase family protein [Spirochaetaceae bacterium]|nr:MAG: hydantoinase/oxoprolinase family protein [Spirochaetaceae bacterium]
MRVASDIGGTFTDLVYLDEATGETGACKTSTTPADYSQGVLQTIKKAGFEVPDTRYFIHGTTVVINAITERKGAKTGLITTCGFRDVLEITRANRPDIYNMYYTKPKPFVPRRYRLEVRERMNCRGEELLPLDEEDVKRAVAYFIKEDIESIAVCFLHSYANPSHEQKCGEIIRRTAPGIPVTLSFEITQEWREYERTNTVVLNSYVLTKTGAYLDNLEKKLSEMGMDRVCYIMQSNGGTVTFDRGRIAPIHLVESGPAGGVIGATALGKAIAEADVISFDVGGTTAKASLVVGGNPRISTDYKIEWRRDFAGYPILAPTIDIVEIGSGGGSLAWVDGGGALRVGPESAGADPGPACYGRGGNSPTVTDANVVAGRINPAYFLGGEIPLHVGLAKKAIKPIAAAYRISIEEAAMGIIRLADSSMVNALKLVSVRRGHDPRDFTLVAFGGGGAMHAGSLIRELKVKKAVVPTNPAVFSAWGMLVTDLRQDFIKTLIVRTDQVEAGVIEKLFSDMEEKAMSGMVEQAIAEDRVLFQRYADMRYWGQEHTVKVPVGLGFFDERVLRKTREKFHQLHEQAYSFRLDSPIEIVNCHLISFGISPKPQLSTVSGPALKLDEAVKGRRLVNFDELGFHDSLVYERDLLPVGRPLEGPLVIEEPASTTVVFPDQRVVRDSYGSLHIEMK